MYDLQFWSKKDIDFLSQTCNSLRSVDTDNFSYEGKLAALVFGEKSTLTTRNFQMVEDGFNARGTHESTERNDQVGYRTKFQCLPTSLPN